MKQFKDKVIIGIDHGYGNIKSANHVFKTGVLKSDGVKPACGRPRLQDNPEVVW